MFNLLFNIKKPFEGDLNQTLLQRLPGWGMFLHKNHAAGEANGSIMVGMFVCCVYAIQKPEFFSRQNGLSSYIKLLTHKAQ